MMLDVEKMGIVGEFPSPYGVSFILIRYFCIPCNPTKSNGVSVSLRSIIHSYAKMIKFKSDSIEVKFPSPYGVSFILMVGDLVNKIQNVHV